MIETQSLDIPAWLRGTYPPTEGRRRARTVLVSWMSWQVWKSVLAKSAPNILLTDAMQRVSVAT